MLKISSVLLASLFVFAGCTKSASERPEKRLVEHNRVEGSLTEYADKIYGVEWIEACDIAAKEKVLEMARALDAKESLISEFNKNNTSIDTEKFRLIPMGPISLRESLSAPEIRAGWQRDDYYTWGEVYASYLKIKNEPVGKNWSSLNRQVRGLLPNDEDRLLNFHHPQLSHEKEPIIRRAISLIDECLKVDTCETLKVVDSEVVAYFEIDTHSAAEHYRSSTLNSTLEAKRDALDRLKKTLAIDLRKFGFFKNESIRHTNGTLNVPFDLSAILHGESVFVDLVSKAWTSDALKTAIEVTPSNFSGAYTIAIEPGSGGRAWVDRSSLSMHIFDLQTSSTLAHETGHVLGFRDAYYTLWSASQCRYSEEYREDDIMSEHLTGKVLPEHITKLKEVYGVE
ncbi:MAG: hypothetical protein V4692_03935 [Bdellovibrionota bacterium]